MTRPSLADTAKWIRQVLGPDKPFLNLPWPVECRDLCVSPTMGPQQVKYELWLREQWCHDNCAPKDFDISGFRENGALVGRTFWFADKAKAALFTMWFRSC